MSKCPTLLHGIKGRNSAANKESESVLRGDDSPEEIYTGAPVWAFFIERITTFEFSNDECLRKSRLKFDKEDEVGQPSSKRSFLQSEV